MSMSHLIVEPELTMGGNPLTPVQYELLCTKLHKNVITFRDVMGPDHKLSELIGDSVIYTSPANHMCTPADKALSKKYTKMLKPHKDINDYLLSFSDPLMEEVYNSENGKLISDVVTAHEFDYGDVKKEYHNHYYDAFNANDGYLARHAMLWSGVNKDTVCYHDDQEDPSRPFIDQYAAYSIIKRWLKYKQVYKVSRGLASALAATDTKGVTWDCFKSLPYPNLFIDMSDVSDSVAGAFIHFNDNYILSSYPYHTLTAVYVYKDWTNICALLRADIPNDRADNLYDILSHCCCCSFEDVCEELKGLQLILINTLLYLNTQKADVEKCSTKVTNVFHTNKKGKRVKTKFTTEVWNVGYRIGGTFTKFKKAYASSSSNSTGRHMRPHIRSGHWHHYWVGKRGANHIELRWVEPMFINCTEAEDCATVEHGIR